VKDSAPEKEAEMKRILVVAAALAVLFAVRRFGPALRDWAETKCEQMMARRRVDARDRFASGIGDRQVPVDQGQR
jgi:hypothetical protein